MNVQTALVLLIILAAVVYVGRRVLQRVRGFSSGNGGSCETGCGKCAPQPKSGGVFKFGRRVKI